MLGFFNKEFTIAKRLFLSAATWSALLLILAGIFLVTNYRVAAEKAFDSRLDVYLRSLVADMAVGDEEQLKEPGQLGDPQFDLAESGWYWQVTRLDGQKASVRQSLSLSGARLPRLSEAGVRISESGVRKAFITGPDSRRLRQFERIIDIGAAGTYLIQVAGTTEDVEEQIWRFKLTLIGTFVLLGLALVGTTALQVRFGLKPLRRLQSEVSAIRRGASEKVAGGFPDDLAPLADEVNLLIASNREIVERSRTHVGNLAHALKTPLSVITNEADNEAGPLASKVREQTQIMRDQVTYYLDRARAAARSSVIGSAIQISGPLEALQRTFEKITRARGVAFKTICPPGLRFRGERQDFEEMAGNLLDNAGKWAKSRVDITARRIEPQDNAADNRFIELIIDDDGPGLPEEKRAEAVARGRRLDETKPGSGLGLSIVADLASVYAGELHLEDSPLGGLRARLTLPAA